jgi:hypothetical protein
MTRPHGSRGRATRPCRSRLGEIVAKKSGWPARLGPSPPSRTALFRGKNRHSTALHGTFEVPPVPTSISLSLDLPALAANRSPESRAKCAESCRSGADRPGARGLGKRYDAGYGPAGPPNWRCRDGTPEIRPVLSRQSRRPGPSLAAFARHFCITKLENRVRGP